MIDVDFKPLTSEEKSQRILKVDVTITPDLRSFVLSRNDFFVVPDEVAFGRLGGFRGVAEKSAGKTVIVGVFRIKGIPNFRRRMRFYCFQGIYLGNVESQTELSTLEQIISEIIRHANGVKDLYAMPPVQDSFINSVVE